MLYNAKEGLTLPSVAKQNYTTHHMTTHTALTELDAAIIAEEQGWEYLPACDEAFLLLADQEQVTVAAAQPQQDVVVDPFMAVIAPKVNKRHLRALLIRDTMECVRSEEDDQSIGWHMINNERWLPLFAGKNDQQVHDYIYGVIRFCERALRYNQ